ncbi:MAG: hypothetical protein RO009_22445 [Pseudorhodoplanes sp.]|nr:hypothetical protein [Pseudorhodoplanes sp.]
MPPKNRKLNALKHGIFSASVVLPGESQTEFDELHQTLVDEWNPKNLIESDAVYCMAKAIWRKKQLNAMRAALLRKKLDETTKADATEDKFALLLAAPGPLLDNDPIDPVERFKRACEYASTPGYPYIKHSELEQLLQFIGRLFRNSNPSIVDSAIKYLPKQASEHLQTHVPRTKFRNPQKWIEALWHEINDILLPAAREKFKAEESSSESINAQLAEIVTTDWLEREIALEERLDAIIDKAIRRLMQSRFIQQIEAGSATPKGQLAIAHQPRNLEARHR